MAEGTYVTWGPAEVEAAQHAVAVGQRRLAPVDTWSAKGGHVADEAGGGYKDLVVDGIPSGQTFDAPIGGHVDGAGVAVGLGFKLSDLIVLYGGITFDYYFAMDQEVLVKKGQDISVGTPLVRLTGSLLPKAMNLSAPAEVLILMGDRVNPSDVPKNVTAADLLRDSEGRLVRLAASP